MASISYLSRIALNLEKKLAEGGGGIELGSSTYLCSISSPVLRQHSGTMLRDVSFEGSDSEVLNVEYIEPYNTLNTRN